jgi:TolB-like protein
MVTEDGHAKIIDPGLAKLVEPLAGEGSNVETAIRGETDPGKVVGTVSYMSPEQARGQIVDRRSDVFSFGIVLYEMLAGEPPFKAPSPPETLSAIINNPAPPLAASLGADSITELKCIIDKCLSKDSGERYQTMKDVVVDLRDARRKLESGTISAVSKPSIAVLPFADMSSEKDQDYFCEGMAEEILNALTKVEGLQVTARTSAFQFKGKAQDVREIGESLNVKTLLEGSVRTAGDRLRITAQLINVADGYHLWSERYDRKMEDVFAIQDEIASRVVEALKVQLLSSEESPGVKVHTRNMEAYHLYLKGQHYRRSRYDIAKAKEFFEQAVVVDPSYSPAYAGLADCYNHLGMYGVLPPSVARCKAKDAAEKALSIDEGLGEAHAVLGLYRLAFEWDWREAEREYKRAIELDPDFVMTYGWYGILLGSLGRKAEALTLARKALELDPLSPLIGGALGIVHYFSGDFSNAVSTVRKVLEIHPDHVFANYLLGTSYAHISMHEESVAVLEKLVSDVERLFRACWGGPMRLRAVRTKRLKQRGS